MSDYRIELRAYLDGIAITSDNIGDIRRSLFFPWDSPWNGCVRDETAERENKTPKNPVPSARASSLAPVAPDLLRTLEYLHFAVNEYLSYSPSRRDSKMGSSLDAAMRAADEAIQLAARDRVAPPSGAQKDEER